MRQMKLKETISNPLYDGIFKALLNTEELEWLTAENWRSLNAEYYLHHSGQKFISRMFKELLNHNTYRVSANGQFVLANEQYVGYSQRNMPLDILSNIIINKFKLKWDKLYDMLNAQYNPIHNYNMNESIERSLESSKTESVNTDLSESTTKSGSSTQKQSTNTDFEDKLTNNLKEVEGHNLTFDKHEEINSKIVTDNDEANKVYGYNSSTAAPTADKAIDITVEGSKDDNYKDNLDTETGNITTDNTGTATKTLKGLANDNYVETTASDSGTITNSKQGDAEDNYTETSGSDTETTEHTKSGNIGVTTTQKMMLEEFDVRDRINFCNIVYKDLDSILCLSVY